MPNTLYWNSVTGQWAAESFGGTKPHSGDTVYFDGRSQKSLTQSADQSVPGTYEYVVNGGFGSDTVWSKGTGWTIAAGVATAAAGSGSDLTQTGILELLRTYRVTYTISGYVAGTLTPKCGTSSGTARSANGTYTDVITCGGNTSLAFAKSATFAGNLDDVSVADSGLQLALFEATEDYLGDFGQAGEPAKLTADKFIWRGQGRLYWTPALYSPGRIIIDTPNVAHEITFSQSSPGVPDLSVRRGKVRVGNLLVNDYLNVGFADNPESDAIVTIDEGVAYSYIAQHGGFMRYDGAQSGGAADSVMAVNGGYCRFNGNARLFIQTGGHVDFGVDKLSAITPAITEAWLIGGSMNTTLKALGQAIQTLRISDRFELQEDSKLTVTTRKKLWE